MPSDEPTSARKEPAIKNPSLWLIVPTLFLLLGQAAAAPSWIIPAFSFAVFLLPLLLLFWREKRAWAFMAIVAGLSLSLGYVRHWQMLHPVFAPSHLRSVISEGAQIYLEGVLRQEPEKLPNRSRWVVSSERIWHPTGSQEITGELLVGVRNARREWRSGACFVSHLPAQRAQCPRAAARTGSRGRNRFHDPDLPGGRCLCE